jgi:hypothetical protein
MTHRNASGDKSNPLSPGTDHDEYGPIGGAALATGLTRAAGAVVLAVILAGYAVGAAGCGGPIVNPQGTPGPRQSVATPTDDPEAIKRVCYAFDHYTAADLARPTVEGDMHYLASLPGVPYDVRDIVEAYWNDPAVRNPGTPAGKNAASLAGGRVNASCKDHGWVPGLKASNQPPKK